MSINKRDRMAKAEKWLDTGNDADLPYACLELRMCLEILVYEKLKFYKKYVPGVVFEKWQPPHALKVLVQFEPHAASNMRIAVAPESAPGVRSGPFESLGEHRFFSVEWLNKNYHKLGSYLHVPIKKAKVLDTSKIRSDLKKIAEEIRKAIECNIRNFAGAKRVNFTCELCGTNCMANADAVSKTHKAFCINPNCGAIYIVKCLENSFEAELAKADFKCLNCGESNYIEARKLKIGVTFDCHNCSTKHEICWGYKLVKPNEHKNS